MKKSLTDFILEKEERTSTLSECLVYARQAKKLECLVEEQKEIIEALGVKCAVLKFCQKKKKGKKEKK